MNIFVFLADRRGIPLLEVRDMPAHEVLLWLRFYDFDGFLDRQNESS